MPFEIRTCGNAEEFARAIGAIGQYFAWHPTPEEAAQFGRNLPLERMHAALDDGTTVGGAGAFPFELSVPGGSLTCAGPRRVVVLELDGAVQAYAAYRHQPKWEGGASVGKIVVSEAFGTSPPATAEIWRFLLDIDWMKTATSSLVPPDHPLFFLLAEPRRLNYRLGDGLWVRLLDVGAALAGRSYADVGRVVFDVRDAFCPENEGRWAVEAGGAEQ